MKKIASSFLIRVLAIFLAVITGTLSIVFLAGTVIVYNMDMYRNSIEDVTDAGRKNLLGLYSRYIFETMREKDLPSVMENSNMEYTIVKGLNPKEDINSGNNKKVFEKNENIIYSNDKNYMQKLNSGIYESCQFFSWDESIQEQPVSLLRSLFDGGYQHSNYNNYKEHKEYVERIFYMDGVFYFETKNYAFPATSIEISASDLSRDDFKRLQDYGYAIDKNDYITYDIKTGQSGKMFYEYCGNGITMLDTSQYKKWPGIIINGVRFMTEAVSEGKPGRGVEIFDIAERNYSYYIEDENNISYEETIEQEVYNGDGDNSGNSRNFYGYASIDYLNIVIIYKTKDETYNNVYAVLSDTRPQLDSNADDLFIAQKDFITLLYKMRNLMVVLIIIPALVFIALLIFCCYSRYICSVSGSNVIQGKLIHRIPFLLYAFIMGCIFFIDIYAGIVFVNEVILYAPGTSMLYITGIASVFLAVLWVMSCIYIIIIFLMEISSRAGAGILLKNTVIYYLYSKCQKIFKFIKYLFHIADENLSLFVKVSAVLVIINLFILLKALFSGLSDMYPGLWLIILVFKTAICAVLDLFVLKIVLQMDALQKHARKMAGGSLESKVDTSKMIWEFKKHGTYLNQIGDGMSAAVNERIKSESLKTELVTNVSHDIKTPLTSIINYIDLLKKEDLQEPKAQEYIGVLERQSARLKKLIEDLMEASKASTGNIAVELGVCNINILLTQTTGEFEEKLQDKGLSLVIEKPVEDILVMADSRHIWRIFDNLMNNICKYGQPGTRVYINLAKDSQDAVIIFRNTSNYQLNISSDELVERFVRGDASRHTEGSGLGLSIAKNLAEIMGGSLELYVDGDLFKVKLVFPVTEA